MQVSSLFRRHRHRLAAVLALAVLAAGCSGGVRPTLTGERLVETPESAAAPTPAPAVDTATEPAPASAPDADTDATTAPASGDVEDLVVQVLETLPHDPTAFTQGLELFNGLFIESTGQYGASDIRRVEPATGTVLQRVPLNDIYFGEGLTRVDNEIIQITWRENTAFYWDANSFELLKEINYDGEGWGLCFDGTQLIMTDGQPELIFRDPVTFAETGRVTVTLRGQEVFNLNEVECINGVVWANVWQSDLIVRIDPATGTVTGLVDAIELDRPAEADVLNGIAWDEATQSFYVTGKYWPSMYRVNFVPAPAS